MVPIQVLEFLQVSREIATTEQKTHLPAVLFIRSVSG